MSALASWNVTSARSVARFTETSTTPGTWRIARSTLPTHDAQVIPSIGRVTVVSSLRSSDVGDSVRASNFRLLICESTLHMILDIIRSEAHTSELQSIMRISYAVFCL